MSEKAKQTKIVIHEDITENLTEALRKIAPGIKVNIGKTTITWEFEDDDESEE